MSATLLNSTLNFNHHYRAGKVDAFGRMVNIEHLNADELDGWVEAAYRKYGKIRITREDGVSVLYLDNGSHFEKVAKSLTMNF